MNRRDNQIFELLCRYGELSVQQLSDILKVSPSSIRRYLSNLDDHPFIRRTHGGAALSYVVQYGSVPVSFPPTDDREARAIAYRAMQLIEPGDVIGLSGGRMCTELASSLRFREGITVVTNAINVAAELVGLPGIKVMVCGGMIELGSFELVGQQVERCLEGIFIHKFFVGTDGITVENGLTNRNEAEAAAARAFAAHAGQTIVLSDHHKFIRSNLARVIEAESITTIVTTSKAAPQVLSGFTEIGVEILLADDTMADPPDCLGTRPSQRRSRRKTATPLA